MKSLIALALVLRLVACNVPYANETQAPTPPIASILQQQPTQVPTQIVAPLPDVLPADQMFPPEPTIPVKTCKDAKVYKTDLPIEDDQYVEFVIPAGTEFRVYSYTSDWALLYPRPIHWIRKDTLC